jgi:capsular exopolysaccharide synthesis family protein
MSVSEIASVLWRRKIVVVLVFAIAIGVAVAALRVITPEYRSTATLSLTPRALGNDLLFLQTVDQVVSLYATAAQTETTLADARRRNGGKLSDISVRTYQAAPIMKIDARGTGRALATSSAQAVADALAARVASGQVGVGGLQLKEIDRPTLPTASVYPNRKLTYAVAALLGLGLGIAAAFLWESFGHRVRTRADLAAAAGVPVFAEVPLVRSLRTMSNLASLHTDPQLRSVAVALRDLRTNLVFSDAGSGSIVVTSPEGRHGKTTISAGLAATIADTGARTLLVDADLHRGRIAELLRLAPAPGLREVLEGADLEECLRPTQIAGLDFLPSGRIDTDPGELLATRFKPILEWLEHEYDAVVVDAPPLTPVNDARVIARLAKATLLVASSGRVSRRVVADAVDRLALIGIVPTAAVLNMSKGRQALAYYGPAGGPPAPRPPADGLRETAEADVADGRPRFR